MAVGVEWGSRVLDVLLRLNQSEHLSRFRGGWIHGTLEAFSDHR